MKVYGGCFDPDTRTLIAILMKLQVPFDLVKVDLLDSNKNEEFRAVNPALTVPVIEEGSFKILGSTQVFINYLANTRPELIDLLPSS